LEGEGGNNHLKKIKIHNIQLKVTPYDGAITNAKDVYMKPNKIITKW
jgi:hypothetical protein